MHICDTADNFLFILLNKNKMQGRLCYQFCLCASKWLRSVFYLLRILESCCSAFLLFVENMRK